MPPFRVVLLFLIAAACTLLAAPASAQITWDGGGDGTSWSSAANWSTDTVPGPTDDVVIPAGAVAVNITAADVTVRSLAVARQLNVNTNRSLTVTTTATISAALSLRAGSTISGGDWTLAPASTVIFPAPCTTPARLTNLTLNGDLPGFNGSVRWNNVNLNGTLTSGPPPPPLPGPPQPQPSPRAAEIAFEGNQTLTGAFVGTSSNPLFFTAATAGTLTVAPSTSISGDVRFARGQCATPQALAVVNNGVISINAPTFTVAFNQDVGLTNGGTFILLNGVIDLTSSFVNTGVFSASGGSIQFSGPVNPATLGNYTTTGSALNVLGGTTDLGGQTWNISGRWRINGTLQNGSIAGDDGALVGSLVLCDPTARLSNLSVNTSQIELSGSFRWNNVIVNGTVVNGAGSLSLHFEGDQLLTGVFSGGSTSSSSIRLQPDTPGTLTIAPTASMTARFINFTSSPCSTVVPFAVVNNGTIRASAQFSTTASLNFSNNGTVAIDAALGTMTFPSLPQNNGTLSVASGATAVFTGPANPASLGNFQNSGLVVVEGDADLAGGTWHVPGQWRIIGTLRNGTADLSNGSLNGAFICRGTRLLNLTIAGSTGRMRGTFSWGNTTLLGTVTFDALSTVIIEGDTTLTGTIIADVLGPPTEFRSLLFAQASPGTFTIAPGASVRGGYIEFRTVIPSTCLVSIPHRVVNNGSLIADRAGRSIAFDTNGSITNNGLISAPAASIILPATTNSTTGLISVPNSNQSSLSFASLDNSGTIDAPNANTGFGSMTNTGSINVRLATFNGSFNPALLGSFTAQLGRTIGASAVADLGGSTWAVTSDWLVGGTVQNGTIDVTTGRLRFGDPSPGTPCTLLPRLNNLTINGNLTNVQGRLRWNNVALNGTLTATASTTIHLEGSQTLTGTFVAATPVGANLWFAPADPGVLTIAPNAVIRGTGVNFTTEGCRGALAFAVVNNGTIRAEAVGRVITVQTGVVLTNNGVVEAAQGQVVLQTLPASYVTASRTLSGGTWRAAAGGVIRFPSTVSIQTIGAGATVSLDGTTSGLLAGSGTVNALLPLTIVDGALELLSGRDFTATPFGGNFRLNGTMTLGPGSVLLVLGSFTQGPSGTLRSFITGTASANIGLVSATGLASLAGTIDVQYSGGYAPTTCSESLQILSADSGLTGAFATQRVFVPGNLRADVVYSPTTVTLVAAPRADIVSIGGFPPGDGLLTGDDFVAFVNAFAASDPIADVCGIGGPPTPRDGEVTPDDFVAFVNSFAAGCP